MFDMMEKKAMIGAILCVGAIVLLGLTFMMPWYSIHMDGSGDYEGSSYNMDGQVDAYFDHAETDMKVSVEGQEMMDEHESDDYNESAESAKVFSNTRIFTIVAMIGSSLGVVGAVLVSVGKLDKKIGTVLILIGLIFAIVAPIYLMLELPSAMEKEMEGDSQFEDGFSEMDESFFGSDNITYQGVGIDLKWGGSTSWYLAFVAAGLNAAGIVLVFLSKPEEERYPQQQYGQQYEQREGEQYGPSGQQQYGPQGPDQQYERPGQQQYEQREGQYNQDHYNQQRPQQQQSRKEQAEDKLESEKQEF